jgi:hypothetical protein
MSWIRVDANLRLHPKAMDLAHELGDPRAHTYLVDLWSWASQRCPTGVVVSKSIDAVIEGACGWVGERGRLFKALIGSGWIDVTESGVEIHDWNDHAGAYVLKAQKDAARKRTRRSMSDGHPADIERRFADTERTSSAVPHNGAECPPNGAKCPSSGARLSPSQSLSKEEEVQEEKKAGALQDAISAEFKKQRGGALRWNYAQEQALYGLLEFGEPELLKRWAIALRRTVFPLCSTLPELLKHWDHYATEQPSREKPKDVRKGHIRAEDMKHSDEVGDVAL